jgi:uncharacterized membrane protein
VTTTGSRNRKQAGTGLVVPWLVWIILAVYLCVFFALAARKFAVMNSNEGDMAVTVNACWNTIHGRLFYCTYIGMSHLGVHTSFAELICVPFYWLIPSVYTLLFLQSLTLTLAGYVFYRVARQVHGDHRTALLLMLGFLFYPTIVTNHVAQIHFEYWSLPYLLAAVYFFVSERFWPFMAFAFLGMTGQENLPLTVGMFGIYALVKRRHWRWSVSPIAMALAYGLFVFNVVIPHFAGTRGYVVSHYFGTLGNTPGELVKTAVTHPWKIIAQMWDADRLVYLIFMLQPLLLLPPLCAWEFLLVLPSLGVNLFVNESAFRVIGWHYNPTVGAFLCVAAVFGVKNLGGWLERHWQLVQPRLILAFGICAVSIASWPSWFTMGEYAAHTYQPTLKKILGIIPPGKSVLSPITMLGHFADRESAFHQLQFDPTQPMSAPRPREQMYTLDYIILDANERRFPKDAVTQELAMSFFTNANYELILDENNVFVFRRRNAE